MASPPIPKVIRIAAVPFGVFSAVLVYLNLVAPDVTWVRPAVLVDAFGVLALILIGPRFAKRSRTI